MPDFYEAPIEEVAARIKAYRAAALGEKRAAEDARQLRDKPIAAPGEPVIFERSTVVFRRLRIAEYIVYGLMLPLVGALAYLIYIDGDASWRNLWPASAAP